MAKKKKKTVLIASIFSFFQSATGLLHPKENETQLKIHPYGPNARLSTDPYCEIDQPYFLGN